MVGFAGAVAETPWDWYVEVRDADVSYEVIANEL